MANLKPGADQGVLKGEGAAKSKGHQVTPPVFFHIRTGVTHLTMAVDAIGWHIAGNVQITAQKGAGTGARLTDCQ